MGLPQTKTVTPGNEVWAIRQALAWAETFLRTADLPDPRLSSELLLGSVLGLDRLDLFLMADQGLQEIEWRSFKEKTFRRARHEPVAYLVGQKEFWSLSFEVNPAVLIPRPETELLVEEGLKCLSEWPAGKTLVELGTGSGAVAIALAKSMVGLKPVSILATDLSWAAIQTARRNADRHGVKDLISFVQGDWLSPFSFGKRWIDLLISNPPYIAEAEVFSLPLTVTQYEPKNALLGGPDGLETVRILLRQASQQLKIGGRLILEIGEAQGAQSLSLAEENCFGNASIRQDYSGRDRILTACYHG